VRSKAGQKVKTSQVNSEIETWRLRFRVRSSILASHAMRREWASFVPSYSRPPLPLRDSAPPRDTLLILFARTNLRHFRQQSSPCPAPPVFPGRHASTVQHAAHIDKGRVPRARPPCRATTEGRPDDMQRPPSSRGGKLAAGSRTSAGGQCHGCAQSVKSVAENGLKSSACLRVLRGEKGLRCGLRSICEHLHHLRIEKGFSFP
jgi:hypothetical protein